MILKLNAWGHIRLLIEYIILGIMSLTLYFYLMDVERFNPLLICVLPLALLVLPVLYLHFSYYSRNSGIIYTISNEGITKNENGTDTFYSVTDFDFIEFRMTKKRRYQLAVKGFLFDDYYFAYVHLKNSEYLIITSLYPQGVEKVLNNAFKNVAKIQYTCTFYPSIMDYKVY